MGLRNYLLVLLVLWAGLAQAQPAVTAGDALTRWLTVYNAAERDAIAAFNAQFDPGADPQADLDFHAAMGQLTLVELRHSRPDQVQAVLASEWGRALLATFTLSAGAAPRLKQQFEGTEMPASARPAPLSDQALAAEADRLLQRFVAQEDLSGSFLIARNGVPFHTWWQGLANREAGTAVDARTVFRFASLGKMFTAVAILQLRDAGKLTLDAPLATYLPDYPGKEVAAAVTVRQLLNHTAGTGEVFGEAFAQQAQQLRTHRDYWALYGSRPLEFPAGSKDAYSNYGYILLGSVIEAVSGQDYYQYMQEHVLALAGMTATGWEPESREVPGRARGYVRKNGLWQHETASLPWRGIAAGGGYSTAEDLLRFATALQGGKLLATASLAEATSPQNHKGWYGLGFMVSGEGDQRRFGHEGGAPGASAVISIKPDSGYVVIGLANRDPGAMDHVVNYISQRLP